MAITAVWTLKCLHFKLVIQYSKACLNAQANNVISWSDVFIYLDYFQCLSQVRSSPQRPLTFENCCSNIFYLPDAFPDTQLTAPKHCKQPTQYNCIQQNTETKHEPERPSSNPRLHAAPELRQVASEEQDYVATTNDNTLCSRTYIVLHGEA